MRPMPIGGAATEEFEAACASFRRRIAVLSRLRSRPTVLKISPDARVPSGLTRSFMQPLCVIRGLGGNGSTFLSRVLAALNGVMLLSETNPASANLFGFELNPVK